MGRKLCEQRVTSNNEASSFNHSLLYMHLKITCIRFVYAMNIPFHFTIFTSQIFSTSVCYCRKVQFVSECGILFRICFFCYLSFSPFSYIYSNHFICYVGGVTWSVVDPVKPKTSKSFCNVRCSLLGKRKCICISIQRLYLVVIVFPTRSFFVL